MRLKIVFRFIGISLLMISGLMMASGILSLKGGADASTAPLFYSTLVTALAGLCPVLFIKHSTYITAKERYAITSGSWIAVCLFGMLPFLMYGHGFTLVNALFESVSGFTTTGASILNDIEALPAGLLLWLNWS